MLAEDVSTLDRVKTLIKKYQCEIFTLITFAVGWALCSQPEHVSQ